MGGRGWCRKVPSSQITGWPSSLIGWIISITSSYSGHQIILIHSVLICHSSVTQSFFLFFTFFMTSIAFKVHINDNWKICPPPFFILKALGAIWWTKWVQKDQNVQVCELSGSGCSKLVELCGTRLQQVRACPGRCIGTISRMRSGHRRCHRPS